MLSLGYVYRVLYYCKSLSHLLTERTVSACVQCDSEFKADCLSNLSKDDAEYSPFYTVYIYTHYTPSFRFTVRLSERNEHSLLL